jgi:hypothetical protein
MKDGSEINSIIIQKVIPKNSLLPPIEELEEIFPDLYSKTTLIELEHKGIIHQPIFSPKKLQFAEIPHLIHRH